MELIILIPAVLCIVTFLREDTSEALRKVVLPVLLVMPIYFYWSARPLPSINFLGGALLALGFGMLVYDLPKWKFSFVDLWIVLFIMSSWWADHLYGRSTESIFELFDGLTNVLMPYMAGKLLIEQPGKREKFTKTFVWVLALSSLFSASEYFARKNLYVWFWSHFFPGQWPMFTTQIRWGGGRVSGPFGQSELAGMMMFAGWLLALWVGRPNWQEKLMPGRGRQLPMLHGKRLIWLTFLAVVMTQARGPWIGAILGLMIASIGFGKKPVVRALVVISTIVCIGLPIYIYGKDYLAGPRKNYGSEKETAQYRQELIKNYIPVAVKGGDWGWGMFYPVQDGQKSIDNEYLFVWVVQGQIGLISLLSIIAGTMFTLIRRAIKAQNVRERHFALTLLGIFLGMCFTISTVFLGGQSFELFFLLVGWSQAIRAQRARRVPIRDIRPLTVSTGTRVYT